MKIILVFSAVIILFGIGVQVFFILYDYKIETHSYKIIEKQGDIEIRKYDPALFISIKEREGMFDIQNQAFRKLAGYIFGSNNTKEKISMTAPVQMEERDNKTVMKFMKYSSRLKDFIMEKSLVPINGFSLLGYNAPYQWINRRNEVLVKIEVPSTYSN